MVKNNVRPGVAAPRRGGLVPVDANVRHHLTTRERREFWKLMGIALVVWVIACIWQGVTM